MNYQATIKFTDEQGLFLNALCKKSGNSLAAEVRASVQERLEASKKRKR